MKCTGVNSCKGTSARRTASSACKGQNACKGQGWTSTAERGELHHRGGKVSEISSLKRQNRRAAERPMDGEPKIGKEASHAQQQLAGRGSKGDLPSLTQAAGTLHWRLPPLTFAAAHTRRRPSPETQTSECSGANACEGAAPAQGQ